MIIDYTIPAWKDNLFYLVIPRLRVLRFDMTGHAARLRDASIDWWTELPSDDTKLAAGRTQSSIEWLRNFYRREIQQLQQYNTANGANVAAYDAAAKAAIDGYLASAGPLNTAFNACMANYRDGSGNIIQKLVSQADRNTLAAAIEGQQA